MRVHRARTTATGARLWRRSSAPPHSGTAREPEQRLRATKFSATAKPSAPAARSRRAHRTGWARQAERSSSRSGSRSMRDLQRGRADQPDLPQARARSCRCSAASARTNESLDGQEDRKQRCAYRTRAIQRSSTCAQALHAPCTRKGTPATSNSVYVIVSKYDGGPLCEARTGGGA